MRNNNPAASGAGGAAVSGLKIVRTVDGMTADDSASVAVAAEMPANARLQSLKRKKMERASREQLRGDRFLWGIYLMLMCYSIIELYSASSSEIRGGHVFAPIIQHAIYLGTGFVLILLMSNIHYKVYRKTAVLFAIVAVVLMVWSTFGGVVINGAQRAIKLGGFTIQPAEIAKLALVVVLAKVISKYQMPQGVTNTGMFIALGISALFCALLFKNGLTNTILIGGTAFSMLVIGGLQMRKLLIIILCLACIGGPIIYKKFIAEEKAPQGTATEQYVAGAGDGGGIDRTELRRDRLKSFKEGVKPTDKITDENRQVIFSKFAQAHGGVLGQGPGNSRENARLPLAFSDYIFSIIIEDTGFVGGVFLLLMYLSLIGAAGRIAVKCRKAFPALLIMGCAVMIVMQALMHMSIVVGIVPVSGQPLPFISKGGTSVIVMSAAMGMMLSVSKFASRTGKDSKGSEAIRAAVADKSETDNPTMLHTATADKNASSNSDPLTY